jgi:preprotein translocase subunit Sec61beta
MLYVESNFASPISVFTGSPGRSGRELATMGGGFGGCVVGTVTGDAKAKGLHRGTGDWIDMSGSSDGGGLMSSAGLVRYFDAEDTNAIRIDPRTVVAVGAFFGLLVQIMNALF